MPEYDLESCLNLFIKEEVRSACCLTQPRCAIIRTHRIADSRLFYLTVSAVVQSQQPASHRLPSKRLCGS